MDPLTHALTSIALGRAGLNRITRAATPMLIVSGLIADVDWVTRIGGADEFLRGHRTGTHSLIGTVVIVVAVAGVSWLVGRKYPRFAVGFLVALAICAIGAGMHLFLDILNGYGVKLLWPFSGGPLKILQSQCQLLMSSSTTTALKGQLIGRDTDCNAL